MDQIEITAEVYRIVRANVDKTPKQIMELLREQLPDVPREQLYTALSNLYESI